MEDHIFTVELTTYAFGGEAIGRLPDGRAVFVPFGMPGEQVRVRLTGGKRGYARADLLEVLTPSPKRISPVCAHFGVCGGCHYQHLAYSDQLVAKTDILRDQLERIGKIITPPVRDIVASPQSTQYRNHVQFHLSPDGALGYYQRRSKVVLAIQECHLPEPTLLSVKSKLNFGDLPDLDRIGLRLGVGDDIQLILESSNPRAPELKVEDLPISVVHLSPFGALVLAGSESVIIEALGRSFRVSAGAFFQVNTPMAEAMVTHILECLPEYHPLTPDTVVIDAYCGVGLFSAFLAPQVGKLIGIESSPTATEDFIVNLDEYENVDIYEARVEDVLPHLDSLPDIILLDPPRVGIDRRVMDALLDSGVPVLVYISCDPATFARDARRLTAGGYNVQQITPFDIFPQTYHIESISFWKKEN